jgi:O-succinylbenzoate synthase
VIREHALRIGDRAVLLLEGPSGWGECSPLAGYPCDARLARLAAEEAAAGEWPAAVRAAVPVSALVADRLDPTAFAGAPAVKVKVGRRPLDRDVARVAEVRACIGPTVALRVDANGAWDLDTATVALTRLQPYDLELAEQPVATLEDLAALRRRVPVRLAADECVRSVDDARRLEQLDAADAVVLKVQPLGGVRTALEVAEASGVPAVVTSMLETSIGIAAGLALACALPELPFACGLATLDEIAGDVTHEPLRPDGWVLRPRRVVPAPDLLARYSETS